MSPRPGTTWLILLGLCASCASGSPLASRTYVRPGLEDFPARSVTVLAVVTPPVALDTAVIEAQPFAPPAPEGPLDGGRRIDAERTEALTEALEATLRDRGFEVERAPPEARGGSLSALIEAAGGDQVLVARAVPLRDLKVLDEAAQSQVLDPTGDASALQIPTGGGTERPFPGEIHLAQLFLFDQATGARLLSEQLPGMPADKQLRREGPLLELGLTGEDAVGLEPDALLKASLRNAAATLTEQLPPAREGRPEARRRLEALDVEAERRREAFFDEGHLAIEIGSGWSFESIGGDSALPPEGVNQPGAELPGLDTGAFAPLGASHALELRLAWVSPGGLSVNGALTYGTIPGRFQRRVFDEAADPGEPDAIATQSIEGGDLLGAAAGVGRLFLLGDDLYLHPSGQLFVEQWRFALAPASTFADGDHTRLGLEARVDLWLTPGGGPLLLRAGLHARGGLDLQGPAFFGGGGSLGVGVLF